MDIDNHTTDIVEEACERYLHQFFPEHTNMPDPRDPTDSPATFRKEPSGEPLGFNYEGLSVEVQPWLPRKDLGIRINVYVVLKDGRMHLVEDSVIPQERIS